MPEIKQGKLENFLQNKFEQVKDKVISLDNLAIQQNFVRENFNFWQTIRFIREEIDLKDSRVDWKAEEAVISMIDVVELEVSVGDKQSVISETLEFQASVVAAFLGQVSNTTIYDLEKIKSFLKGDEVGVDKKSLVFSLRQDLNHPDGRDAALYFIKNILNKINNHEDFSWYQTVVFIVLYHTAFRYFDSFDDGTQKSLLKFSLFTAVLVGVPVRDQLAKFLYDTDNVSDLLIDNQLLYDAISNNEEKIYLEGKALDLKILVSDFVAKNDDILNVDLIKKYVGGLASNGDSEKIKDAVVECINIYSLVHEVKLVDHNSSQDLPESEIAFRQTEKLLLLFANRVHWPEMLEYFTEKEGNYVSWKSFLRGFVDADLGDEAVVEKITFFGEFLKTNGFLKADQDLIEYHESDNQFHWNEKIFS